MAKSFCSGCLLWKWADPTFGSNFRYCEKLNTDSLLERKEFCGGKYKKIY